ncbi:MAG TPA: hypothetical protein VGL53_09175 [Bryobacteraceae bacterium]|jgi:hypothetical protein
MEQRQARWPALFATLGVGGLYLALPSSLTIGPTWLPLVIVGLLAIPVLLFYRSGRERANQLSSYVMLGVITAWMLFSLVRLIIGMAEHTESPKMLLLSAALLWVSNILVFASWYWRLDAGGPNARDRRETHDEGAFLFPQMTMQDEDSDKWSPGFVDYLFLAFNTSTAFSPTDCPVLSRWAKVMMMLQASISLATLALLAARAVNIL